MAQSEIFISSLWNVGVLLWSISILKGSRDRANSKAKTASCAVSCYLWLMSLCVKSYCLISGIKTSHIAFTAVHT